MIFGVNVPVVVGLIFAATCWRLKVVVDAVSLETRPELEQVGSAARQILNAAASVFDVIDLRSGVIAPVD